jgi:IS1 family transposase
LTGAYSRVAKAIPSTRRMSFVNNLSREKQIEVIAALCEGVGQRAVTRLTGCDRKTVARLALRVGRGCQELHDRIMVGIRVNRLELDEAWSFVGKKQKKVLRHEINAKGDQYVFIGMAGTQKAIISWGVGKRTTESTMDFLHDLRSRVIGQPEISTDGFHPYRVAIRDAFGDGASHGVLVKTYSVTNLAVKDAARRYSPAEVVAVSREVVSGDPDQYISTSYVERQNLSLRMGSRRFTRLTNGFSKKLDNHVAAVALYVAHYNLCRVHEALKATPAKALGVVDRNWSIGELIDAALATQPITPVPTAPERRKLFTVIDGGKR